MLSGFNVRIRTRILTMYCVYPMITSAFVMFPKMEPKFVSVPLMTRNLCLRSRNSPSSLRKWQRFTKPSIRTKCSDNSLNTNDNTKDDLKAIDEWDVPETYQRYQGEIFCNRALNMKRIAAVGFDMDYTLAQYIPETFEVLAEHGAMEKLVNFMGYPSEILSLPDYDPNFFQRGLVIDKLRGNIIKLDRHMYVKVAFHGMNPLNEEERRGIYGNLNQKSFSSEIYANIDTLFSLPDAFMFCHLVDFKDAHSDKFPMLREKSYAQIYKDVRRSVDLCHRDGFIKNRVMDEPEKFIQAETGIVDMLRRFKNSGRKVFLLTNSLWDYTHAVMNHVTGRSRRALWTLDWLDLFDLVIVGASKPSFLEDPNLPIFRVHTEVTRPHGSAP